MPKAPVPSPLPSDLTFESAMKQLEDIVRQLESGQGSLEEAIQHYEKGAALRAFCQQRLADAELRISQISLSAGGEVSAAPFADQK